MKSKVVKILVLLLVVVCLLAGCTSEFEIGAFGRDYRGRCATLYKVYAGVRSNTDTFAKDNVTLDLYYGLFDIDEKEDIDKKYGGYGEYDDFIFAIYVNVWEYTPLIYIPRKVEDYQNIENVHFIKEISREEALSGNYGYKIRPLLGLKYYHHENLTIPQDLFTAEYGRIEISVVIINTSKNPALPYIIYDGYFMEFSYEFIDDNTVELHL